MPLTTVVTMQLFLQKRMDTKSVSPSTPGNDGFAASGLADEELRKLPLRARLKPGGNLFGGSGRAGFRFRVKGCRSTRVEGL